MDLERMQRALELAERGRGFVEPNPLVGAVVERDGRIVGEGWHERFGGPHAEVHALAAAGESARGGTLYVTLEPCCHYGKTPPCTDTIIRAGVRRVVAAMTDPFSQVAGKGAERLRQAGIEVEMGVGGADAQRLNAPYLKLITTGRPYVHAKWAMTLDGKIATRTGSSRWISNETSRRIVHQLRGRMDAIVTGIGTVLADDPLLTARPPGPRTACRIVLDRQARLQLTSKLVRTARDAPVLVVSDSEAPTDRIEALRDLGIEVHSEHRCAVPALLDELGRRRMTNILVEGGSGILGAFFDARAIDEVHAFIAPRLAGGHAAPSAIAGGGVEQMSDALGFTECSATVLDGDVYLHGRI